MDVRPTNVEELVEILTRIDPAAPARRDALGRRVYDVRCRIPVVLDAPAGGFRFRAAATSPEAPEAREAGGDPNDSTDRGAVLDRIEGPASSTSQDWYGTRMTRPCLESMAEQFKRGVDYLPRHHSFMASVEWYDVMGRTVDARLERGQVKAAPEGEDPNDQWVLYCTTDLYADSEQAPKMLSRIRAGHPPGQSIGGWFTQVSVTYDEDGSVVYPIDVLDVALDHLASVRSPANPDADRVWLAVQRALAAAGEALRSPPTGAAAPQSESAPPPSEELGACGSTSLPLADESTPWSFSASDFDAVLGDPPKWSKAKSCHFWVDPEKADEKGGYKLPFAKEIDGEIKAVWHGVAAAYSALNGGHGGTTIPESDHKAIRAKIKHYYGRFGKEWPAEEDLKSSPAASGSDADPDADTDRSTPDPVVIDLRPGDGIPLSLSADDFAPNNFDEVLRRLNPSGQGAPPPSPDPVISGRATTHEDNMPLTDEQLAELIGGQVARSLTAALAPLVSRIDALEARGPSPTPAPEPEPEPETPREREARERYERAEARLARLEAEPQRQAARNTQAPAHQAAGGTGTGTGPIPEYARIGRDGDLRQIAPQTARIIARAGDDITPDEIPHMVFQRDGLDALAGLVKATGEARAVGTLVERERTLTADPVDFDPDGKNVHDFGIFRGGIHPKPTQLRAQSDSELRSLLRDVIRAGVRDRLIHAAW